MSDFVGKLIDAEHAGKITSEQFDAVVQSLHIFKVAIDEATVENDWLNASVDKGTTAHKASTDATDANRAALDRHKDALDDARDATDRLRDANKKLRDDLSNRGAYLDLLDTFDQLKVTGDDAWYAVASGADDAQSKVRDYEQAQIDAKLELEAFLDTMDVPFDKRVDIQTAIDNGEYMKAAGMINELTEDQTVQVHFMLNRPKKLTLSRDEAFNIVGTSAPAPTATATGATVSAYGPAATTTATDPAITIPVRLALPSASQISRQIGPLRLAVTAALTGDRRLAGVRD
jgi:hypothetical protein